MKTEELIDNLEELSRLSKIGLKYLQDQKALKKLNLEVGNFIKIEKTKDVISAMIEDVCREAKGEIIESRAAKSAIGKEAARLYKNHISKV